MHAVLDGRDSVVVLPTGGGKSLCFQAPAVVDPTGGPSTRRGVALVVSPLISLMKDQVDGLRVDGVAAAVPEQHADAGERDEVARERARAIAAGCCTCRPSGSSATAASASAACCSSAACGSSPSTRRTASASGATISGPSTGSSGGCATTFPASSLHAFTATATERVRRDIVARAAAARSARARRLVRSAEPHLPRAAPRQPAAASFCAILARHEGEAGIVYCLSRREVEALADVAGRAKGIRAVPYHAGLSDDVRSRHQEAFLDERADIVVATVAFGMGIDRSNVRFVVHAGAPRSPEHYQQESGRAGRDGLPAECVLIYSGADFVRWRQMLEANGELTDERARAAARHGALRRGHALPPPRRSSSTSASRTTATTCGACDWCLKELDAVADSTTVARKILSCVARVKQRLGHRPRDRRPARDAPARRSSPQRHDAAVDVRPAEGGVGGGGARLHRAAGRRGLACARRRAVSGAAADGGRRVAAARATASARCTARSCRRRESESARRARRRESARRPIRELFDVLRDVRLRLARERGVPPYVIFHDTTLREMAERRPRRSTTCTTSTASARRRRPTSATRSSMRSGRSENLKSEA